MPDRKTKGGYESGSMSVSELSIPDVLFQPGAGAAPRAGGTSANAAIRSRLASIRERLDGSLTALNEAEALPETPENREQKRAVALQARGEVEGLLAELTGVEALLSVGVETKPRVPILPCPKCGETNTKMRWCDGGYTLTWGNCAVPGDHFHRECPRCRYGWSTHDVLTP